MGFKAEKEDSPDRYGSKVITGDDGGLPSTSFLAAAAHHQEVIYEETVEEHLPSLRKPSAAPKIAPLPLLKINTTKDKEVQKLFDNEPNQ